MTSKLTVQERDCRGGGGGVGGGGGGGDGDHVGDEGIDHCPKESRKLKQSQLEEEEGEHMKERGEDLHRLILSDSDSLYKAGVAWTFVRQVLGAFGALV